MSFLDELGDELGHFRNVFGSVHENRLFDSDHSGIFEKCLLVFRRVLLHADAISRRVANDLVVYVGNIHDVPDRITALPQEPAQQIDGDECAEVANMPVIVDGRAAGIHAHFRVAEGAKLFHLRRHRVEKTKGHGELKRRETNLRF